MFSFEIFTREIEARPARVDPLTHAQRLTAVFYASGSLNQYNILTLTSPPTMTTSVTVITVSKASPRSTAGVVQTKLCTFRCILNKTKVAMSHYSSKINYRGATHPSNLSTTVAKWIALHLTSEKIEE